MEYQVQARHDGQRIDKVVPDFLPELTRSYVQKLLEDGHVLVDGRPVKANYKLKAGQVVSVSLPEEQALEIVAEDIPLSIVYEDDSLLVINKPRGMVVHPAAGNYTGTLVNGIMAHCGEHLSGINGVLRPGIVHRIDKDTTGLLVVAKTNRAHLFLSDQLQDHSLYREYEAIVHGNIKDDEGTVCAPIGRDEKDRKKMCVTPKGREATTHFTVLERFGDFTYLRCRLETGRTHQIRVHMRHIGHPILGDAAYGVKNQPYNLAGQLLHARRISFVHPDTDQRVTFDCPLPEDFEKILSLLRKKNGQTVHFGI